MASQVHVGDQVSVVAEGAINSLSLVLSVRRTFGKFDMFAPMTRTGTIVVDGVLASNYGNVASHGAAHAAFFPVRAFHYLGILAVLPSIQEVAFDEPADEMHPWARLFHNQYFKLDEMIVLN